MAFCSAARASFSEVEDWRHWPRVYAAMTISSSVTGPSSSSSGVVALLGGSGLLVELLVVLDASLSFTRTISSTVWVSWQSEDLSQGCLRHCSAVALSLNTHKHRRCTHVYIHQAEILLELWMLCTSTVTIYIMRLYVERWRVDWLWPFPKQHLDEGQSCLVQLEHLLLGVAHIELGNVEKRLLLVLAHKWRDSCQHHVGQNTNTPVHTLGSTVQMGLLK